MFIYHQVSVLRREAAFRITIMMVVWHSVNVFPSTSSITQLFIWSRQVFPFGHQFHYSGLAKWSYNMWLCTHINWFPFWTCVWSRSNEEFFTCKFHIAHSLEVEVGECTKGRQAHKSLSEHNLVASNVLLIGTIYSKSGRERRMWQDWSLKCHPPQPPPWVFATSREIYCHAHHPWARILQKAEVEAAGLS